MEAMAPSSSSPVAISPLGIVVRSSRPVEAARMTSAFGKDGEGHWQEGEEGEYRGIAKLEAEVSKLRGELSRNNVDLENAKEKIIEVDTERKILMGLYSTASTELQNCREELAKVVKESVASGKQLKEKTKQLEEKKKQMKQSRDVLGAKEDGLVVRKEKEMCSSLQDLEEKLKRVEEESGRAAGDLVKAQLQIANMDAERKQLKVDYQRQRKEAEAAAKIAQDQRADLRSELEKAKNELSAAVARGAHEGAGQELVVFQQGEGPWAAESVGAEEDPDDNGEDDLPLLPYLDVPDNLTRGRKKSGDRRTGKRRKTSHRDEHLEKEREKLKRCFDDRHHMQKGNLVRCQATGCQSRSSSQCKGCLMAFCAVKGKNCFASHHDPMFVKYINEHMCGARDV